MFVTLFVAPFADLASYLRLESWTALSVLPWLLVGLLGWWVGRLVHSIVKDALAISRLAARVSEIDLFDLRPLAPFVQQGLRSSLLVVLLVSISSNLALDPAGATLGSALNVAGLGAAALVALVVPAWGIHLRIRDEKRAQLSALRATLDADRRAVLERKPGIDAATARLPGVLALEARLEAVREWPFDASALGRFGFYVAIGLGSWVGAAAVERLLDVALN